jgi:1,4-alpha-glucan branching enzyme
MPGILDNKENNVILANAFLTVFPGKKWNFMGTDTFCEDAYCANPYAAALKENKEQEQAIACIKDLFALYKDKALFRPAGENKDNFTMIKSDDPADCVLIYQRKDAENTEYIIFNFSNHDMDKYSFGLPNEGKIKEIFTTDEEKYGRAGLVNKNAIATKEIPMDGFKQSVTVKIPAMGMQIFSYRDFTDKERAEIEKKKYMEKVRYVEKKKKEIEAERDRLIDEAKKEAERKIKEVEKILKQ